MILFMMWLLQVAGYLMSFFRFCRASKAMSNFRYFKRVYDIFLQHIVSQLPSRYIPTPNVDSWLIPLIVTRLIRIIDSHE